MNDSDKGGAPSTAPKVHNGTYTVDHPERGHFTLKLYTAQKGNLAGKRIIALMIGSDNESDFRGLAFWDDEKGQANTWTRFRSPSRNVPLDGLNYGEQWNASEKKLAIWANLVNEADAGYWHGEGYRLLLEGRCVVCNRKLTNPESIQWGIGPECRSKV